MSRDLSWLRRVFNKVTLVSCALLSFHILTIGSGAARKETFLSLILTLCYSFHNCSVLNLFSLTSSLCVPISEGNLFSLIQSLKMLILHHLFIHFPSSLNK